MKYQTLAVAATTLISAASAFPRMNSEQLATYKSHSKKSPDEGCPYAAAAAEAAQEKEGKVKRSNVFDAKKQYIDVSGENAFIPPNFEAGDQRGPCPGLNALANHGFLPHNGVADMQTIIKAVSEVYGMSLDLGGFLAVYGTVFDGNPLSTSPGYSIGGPTEANQNIINGGGILGTPSGLSGSHNKYESDVSPTRGDLYVTGNNFHVVQSRFEDYYTYLQGLQGISADEQYDGLAPFHKQRFDESVDTNPYFFYSPFAGILVSPAGYSFPVRMMANHSAEFPEGSLTPEVFASFFGVYGTPGNFEVKQGWEQIPKDWYKRPLDDEYSIPDFLVDVLHHASYYPKLLSFGGNRGKVDSYAAVDITNLTGGLFETAKLATSDYLECFVLQSVMAAAPDFVGSLFTDVQKALTPISDKVYQLLANKACPVLQEYNSQLFEEYPGYKEAYGGYAGLEKLGNDPVGGLSETLTGVVGGLIKGGLS